MMIDIKQETKYKHASHIHGFKNYPINNTWFKYLWFNWEKHNHNIS